jgi:hypothetical protein
MRYGPINILLQIVAIALAAALVAGNWPGAGQHGRRLLRDFESNRPLGR